MSDEKKVGQVKLKNVRLSFAHIFEKTQSTPTAKPKFSASFLMDPSTPDGKANIAAIVAARRAVEIKTHGEEFVKRFPDGKIKYKEDRNCFFKGDDKVSQKSGLPYDGWAGMVVLTAGNQNRFPIVDRNRAPLTKEDGRPYSGCYVNVVVSLYGIKNDDVKRGGLGLFAVLEAVQFAGDGEAFGAAPVNPDDVFDDMEGSSPAASTSSNGDLGI